MCQLFLEQTTFCFSLRVWVKDFRRTINSTVIPNSKKTLKKPITCLGSIFILHSLFLVKFCKFLSTLKGRKARVRVIFCLVIPITQVSYIPWWNLKFKSCPKVHFWWSNKRPNSLHFFIILGNISKRSESGVMRYSEEEMQRKRLAIRIQGFREIRSNLPLSLYLSSS